MSTLTAIREHIPDGRAIDDEQFEFRHRLITAVLFLHIPGLFVVGLANNYSVLHTTLEVLPVAVLGGMGRSGMHRLIRSIAASLGMVYAASALIHFTGGVIEAHFHWFVVLTFTSLYVDLRPFVAVIIYTVTHHTGFSLYDSSLVFEHERGQESPFLWTLVHVFFTVLLIIGLAINWYTLQLQHKRWTDLADDQHRIADEQHEAAVRQAELAEEAAAMAKSHRQTLDEQQEHAQDLAVRSSNLATTSASVREIIGETSSTMTSITDSTGSIAEEVHRVLDLAVQANQEAVDTRSMVEELDERSQRITEMVDLIAQIADQTNLLALNATIEAERAGTSGRGFAVVASEVKSLAQQTSEATDRIREITDDVRSGVSSSASKVSGVAELVDAILERQQQVELDVRAQQEHADQARSDVQAASQSMLDVIHGIDQLSQTASGALVGSS